MNHHVSFFFFVRHRSFNHHAKHGPPGCVDRSSSSVLAGREGEQDAGEGGPKSPLPRQAVTTVAAASHREQACVATSRRLFARAAALLLFSSSFTKTLELLAWGISSPNTLLLTSSLYLSSQVGTPLVLASEFPVRSEPNAYSELSKTSEDENSSSSEDDEEGSAEAEEWALKALISKLNQNLLTKLQTCGYTAEVTNLSPIATEKELHHFFALCGKIDRIQILRASEVASTAYVTFRSSHALEIAVFLNGAIIVDQPVCIARWEHYKDDDIWNQICWKSEEATHSSSIIEESSSDSGVGEQDGAEKVMSVVKTMLSKGYVLGKDGLERARALEQSHQVSASILKALSEAAEAAVEFGSQGMHY
nr:binding partner of ACD11 1 [Ipomoea batatas]